MKIQLFPALSFYQLGHRANQEDARFPDTDTPDASCSTFIVCDGVGGCNKGEVASATVSQTIGNAMAKYNGSEIFTNDDFAVVLGEAYHALDVKNVGDARGMATTLTFLHSHAGGIFLAHIGDSRIYQIRPNIGVIYRSYDHSLVNALLRNGLISPNEAVNHPKSNVITRCMGSYEDGRRDSAYTINITDVRSGDYFLLCSDGVLHQFTDETLVALLESPITDEDKIKQMAATSAPSADNNTAMLIHVADVEDAPAGIPAYIPDAEADSGEVPTISIPVPQAEVHEIAPTDSKPEVKSESTSFKNFWKKIF